MLLQERKSTLLNKLLCLKESPQVEDLPHGQEEETGHGEDAEIEHSSVGRLWKMERDTEKEQQRG